MALVSLALVVLAGQLLTGLWLATRVAHRLHLGPAAILALTPLLGIVVVGSLTLVVGHLSRLGAWLPWSVLVFGALAVGLDRGLVAAHLRSMIDAIRSQWRRAPVSVTAVLLGLGMATLASLAPPSRTDEVEYHWAAPVEWAAEGRWVGSSFRHVDSFPFMEVAYTYAATLGSYAGAHLLHLTTLVALGAAAAWAAGAVGVRSTGAVGAAAIAMPVIWDQAYVAYNDTAVGGFSMAAVALAVRDRWSKGTVLLTCALLGAAISIKPTAIGAVGVVGLIVLWDAIAQRTTASGNWLGRVAQLWVPLILTSLVTLGFWTLRRFLITGTWVDMDVVGPPTADELSRLPTLTDQLLAPVMPLVLGVLGSDEPWGGRTALVLQLLLIPAILYALWRRGDMGARFARVAVPAWVHWVVVGLQGVRTRFHVISWAMLVVAVRVVVEDAGRAYPRLRPWLAMAWSGAVVLGVVDSMFEMVRAIQTIEF